MHQPITFAVIFSYAIMFISKGIPIIIGLISLFRLLPKAGSNSSQVSHCLPNLIVILACISMLAMTWSSTLGLAIVCVAIIVMNKLKPDNI
jgi:hypothetical protein